MRNGAQVPRQPRAHAHRFGVTPSSLTDSTPPPYIFWRMHLASPARVCPMQCTLMCEGLMLTPEVPGGEDVEVQYIRGIQC